MEIILDPNVAYLILMVGVVLAIMALFAPGTGVLEVGALFMLFLAGWEISQQPINLWALLVLILGVVPFIIAVRRSHKLIYLVIALIGVPVPQPRSQLVAARCEPGAGGGHFADRGGIRLDCRHQGA
jgi:membrane-bound ClpP family serine protease